MTTSKKIQIEIDRIEKLIALTNRQIELIELLLKSMKKLPTSES